MLQCNFAIPVIYEWYTGQFINIDKFHRHNFIERVQFANHEHFITRVCLSLPKAVSQAFFSCEWWDFFVSLSCRIFSRARERNTFFVLVLLCMAWLGLKRTAYNQNGQFSQLKVILVQKILLNSAMFFLFNMITWHKW